MPRKIIARAVDNATLTTVQMANSAIITANSAGTVKTNTINFINSSSVTVSVQANGDVANVSLSGSSFTEAEAYFFSSFN